MVESGLNLNLNTTLKGAPDVIKSLKEEIWWMKFQWE
jgi:hypothetical protein